MATTVTTKPKIVETHQPVTHGNEVRLPELCPQVGIGILRKALHRVRLVKPLSEFGYPNNIHCEGDYRG